jgi:hypothetical protein
MVGAMSVARGMLTMIGRRLSVVTSHGDEVHAALGAVTRLVGDDLRVHRAGVLGATLAAGGVLVRIAAASCRCLVRGMPVTMVVLVLRHGIVSVASAS